MKNIRLFIGILLAVVSLAGFAQNNVVNRTDWNGYTQLRFTTDFDGLHKFAMRRMKLWLYAKPGQDQHWGYKVQTTISSNQNEKFLLQDVLVYYQPDHFRINLGQFIPHYSLQRFQPDYTIPLTERAQVINALIPDGTLGVRDIGAEVNYHTRSKNFETWFGIFNGSGIKQYDLDNSGIMLTHKTSIRFLDRRLTAGYSAMYRKADQLRLPAVLPDSVLFSGDDFRYNLFARFSTGAFGVQAEYLRAFLNGKIADGYYILATLNLHNNQLVASYEKYNNLIDTTKGSPVVHLGYNYLFDHDKLKIMLDNSARINDGKLKFISTVLQLQLFFG